MSGDVEHWTCASYHAQAQWVRDWSCAWDSVEEERSDSSMATTAHGPIRLPTWRVSRGLLCSIRGCESTVLKGIDCRATGRWYGRARRRRKRRVVESGQRWQQFAVAKIPLLCDRCDLRQMRIFDVRFTLLQPSNNVPHTQMPYIFFA